MLPDLAQGKELRVRVAVANQPRTPFGVLKVLAADANVKVRTAVHKNRSAIVEIKVVTAPSKCTALHNSDVGTPPVAWP